MHNEKEVRDLTEVYYGEFRKKHLKKFDFEIKPLVREWKKFEKQLARYSRDVPNVIIKLKKLRNYFSS